MFKEKHLIVIRNTYPVMKNCPSAKQGDICHWEKSHGRMSLIRNRDSKTIFSRDLLSPGQHDGNRPVVGVIAEVKNKGWVLEINHVNS
ncbi:hypothetical protein VZ94_00840 [Methylocucumis oryzae]|uniref:Uncharacterized protein n=2 Tax=Methylocucumis oryzae TaxID=1632867 RepID=A0A0F3IMT3_9GAMM|nr:hypothetical protein VZ94_00840 [Methylocucumis oryzae]